MFKKITAVILLAAMLVTFVSCKKEDRMTLRSSEIKLEIGSEMSTEVTQYVTGPDDIIQNATMDTTTVDTTKIGSYTVAIKSGDQTLNLKVTVEDTTAPIIELNGDSISEVLGNNISTSDCVKSVTEASEYQIGFITDSTATDKKAAMLETVSYDEVGTYSVEIYAVDAAGNESSMPVTITVEDVSDTQNPGSSIDISSDFSSYSNESIPFGVGTDVDENNRPTGLGWYSSKYGQYADDFIQPMSNYVYLTFDEGYENGFTPTILDTLKEKNVKAVFFCTLPFIKENPDLVQRMIDEGHVVGNHSVTHPSAGLPSLSIDEQISEVKTVNDYVLENFNYQMYLWRFPTGAFSEQSLAIVQSLGYRSIFWSFAYDDYHTDAQPDVNEALTNALSKVHGGAIYLLHAVSSTNTSMLGDFIDGVRAKGFEFGYYNKVD